MIQIAHGLVARSDLPIPEWLFGWAAAMVLVVSFVALAVLWPEPKLEEDGWRPLPGRLGRVLAGRAVEIVCGAIGVFLFGLVVYSRPRGRAELDRQLRAHLHLRRCSGSALVPASVLFGDVFRAFNPWRAIGRAVAGVAKLLSRGQLPAPLPYPERLGRWPAAAGIFAFAALELVAADGDKPETLAIAALDLLGGHLHRDGAVRDRGLDATAGEAFSVYFNLFSRIAPVTTKNGEVGLRKPLSGLAALPVARGHRAAARGDDRLGHVRRRLGGVALDGHRARHARVLPGRRALARRTRSSWPSCSGCSRAVILVYGFYRLGDTGGARASAAASAPSGWPTPSSTRSCRSPSPTRRRTTSRCCCSRARRRSSSSSDPLGEGSDLFGTANSQIDYTVIGGERTWYWQVAFVVAGHVAALILAHDRALALYDDARWPCVPSTGCWP